MKHVLILVFALVVLVAVAWVIATPRSTCHLWMEQFTVDEDGHPAPLPDRCVDQVGGLVR
jgi:hypothetical protein